MAKVLQKKMIRQVFRKVQTHRRIEQSIRLHSTNKDDIRKTALSQTDLSHCKNVLELGCAFGAFTEALQGKLHKEARISGLDIIPEYQPFFLEACRRAGYSGTFSPAGVDQIKKFPSDSFDLVICSFALYFFIDMIPEIARVLKKDGFFITITHFPDNMRELTTLAKTILSTKGLLDCTHPLPVETLIRQFSAENGENLLHSYFVQIQEIDFRNKLVFRPEEIDNLIDYFHFKSPFFLIGTDIASNTIVDDLSKQLQKTTVGESFITMSKDDRIFICSQPLAQRK